MYIHVHGTNERIADVRIKHIKQLPCKIVSTYVQVSQKQIPKYNYKWASNHLPTQKKKET